MNFFRLLLWAVLFYFVFRLLSRIGRVVKGKPSPPNPGKNFQGKSEMSEIDKPKFNIEAESVDYEIIDEPKKENEK